MKIAIIGSGWLGLPLAESLQKTGSEVVISYRSSKPDTLIQNFQYPGESTALLGEVDVVVLAFPPSRESTEQYSLDCLEVIGKMPPGTHVLLTSSTSVYPDEATTMSETFELNAENTGNARIWAAELALEKQLGENLTVIRLGGLIGPGRYPVTAMARTGKQYTGDEPLNVLHLDDAVGLIQFAIENRLTGTINAVSPNHPSKKEYYTWMAQQLECAIPDLSGKSGGGKTIDSAKSMDLGYVYKRPDPFQFL